MERNEEIKLNEIIIDDDTIEIDKAIIKKLSKAQTIRCHLIIHSSAIATAVVGAGLTKVTCSDNFVITPIQITMTIALGNIFGIELTKSMADAMIHIAATTMIGRAASQVILSNIPKIGNIANAITAAAITEMLGWVIIKELLRQSERSF